jgi:hypothetical protein
MEGQSCGRGGRFQNGWRGGHSETDGGETAAVGATASRMNGGVAAAVGAAALRTVGGAASKVGSVVPSLTSFFIFSRPLDAGAAASRMDGKRQVR